MDRFEQHYDAWMAAKEAAVRDGTCFCAHGCTSPATHRQWFLGIDLPGLCDECHRLSGYKASKKEHFLMKRPTDTFTEDEQPSRIRSAIARVVNLPRRIEAEAYVREYGPNGLRVVSDLYNKVVSGQHLTAVETDAVLRSKEAEKRSSETALRRIQKTERKAAKAMDLNRVFIGDDVTDGDYAVIGDDGEMVRIRVSRQAPAGFHGFIIVSCIVGEGVSKWGVQYPQPARLVNGYRQWYRGEMAHLVAKVASNPAAARSLLEQAEKAA